MTTVSITDFSARPLDYLQRTEAGEPIEIVRDGQPIVRLAPVVQPAPPPSGDEEATEVDPRELLLGMSAPKKPLVIPLPSKVVVERRLPEISSAWFPSDDEAE
jgi:prevent-host-death family protein